MRVSFSGKSYWSRTPTKRLRRSAAKAQLCKLRNLFIPIPSKRKSHSEQVLAQVKAGKKSLALIVPAALLTNHFMGAQEMIRVAIIGFTINGFLFAKTFVLALNDPVFKNTKKLQLKAERSKAAWIAEKRGCASWTV